MEIRLDITKKISERDALAVVVNKNTDLKAYLPKAEEWAYVKKKLEDSSLVVLHQPGRNLFFIKEKEEFSLSRKREAFRRSGCELSAACRKEKLKKIQLCGEDRDHLLAIAEGVLLASYRFLKYKSQPSAHPLKALTLVSDKISKEDMRELQSLAEAIYITRDLVNEPVVTLNAVRFSEEMKRVGKLAGFKVEVLTKSKIQSLKMGGLLSVNHGSVDPPTFNILEYKPAKPRNKRPYILVGKGIVYDTGGLSLKSAGGMEKMKCDMAGGAAVIGAMYAIAKNKLPVHVIGLIPATDNRINGNAMAPGDVITISNGKTVEVLNTDAEGRLVLADALSFASRYRPELVIDLATLTGAAARAIGKDGIVFMGNASAKVKSSLMESGEDVYERLVEFPMWDEFGKQIESDIADIKNIGDGDAGAITAGKFLEHFVDYEWLHLDIAGPAYLSSFDGYRGKNATGVGVRLLYNFFKKI